MRKSLFSSLFIFLFIFAFLRPEVVVGYFYFSDDDAPSRPIAEYSELKNWHLQNELLCWVAHVDGLAFTNKASDVLTTDDFTETSSIHPHFKWDYGYRFIGAYTPICSPWSFVASWTSIELHARGKRIHNSGEPEFEGAFPVWSISPATLAGDYVSEAELKWHVHANIIDIDAEYEWKINKKFTLIPQFGIRFAILNQKVHAEYEGGSFFSGTDDNEARNNFFGVGPRIGTAAAYHLCYGFSLVGFVAVTPMYGHFDISHKEEYLDEERFHETREQIRCAWAFDYQAGLQWKGVISCNWPEMLFGAYWEGHTFYKQNRMLTDHFDFNDGTRNLTLQGVTLSASVCF